MCCASSSSSAVREAVLALLLQDGCRLCFPHVHDPCVVGTRLHRLQARQYSRQTGRLGWLMYVCSMCAITRPCDLAQGVASGVVGIAICQRQSTFAWLPTGWCMCPVAVWYSCPLVAPPVVVPRHAGLQCLDRPMCSSQPAARHLPVS
jgi:hypothetical protein